MKHTKNKAPGNNTQGKSSNGVVRKPRRNAVARLSRVLLAEIKTVSTEGPDSGKLHASGLGWQTGYQSAPDMMEEMEAWLKGGVLVLRINQKKLAKKMGLSERSIFTNLPLFVETGVIRPLPDRGLYWVGRRDKSGENFIPMEIVLDELRDLRLVERVDEKTGTHPHRRLFQELLRLKIGIKLLGKAGSDCEEYWRRLQKRLKILRPLTKRVPLGKTGVPRKCKNLIWEIVETEEFKSIVFRLQTSHQVFLNKVLKSLKRIYLLGCQKPEDNGRKPSVPNELPREFCAELEKLAKRQQRPVRDLSEKALKLPFLAERIVLNSGNDDLRITYQLQGDEAFLPKLKRAVGYVDEISKSTRVKHSDLWKCVFARYLSLHSGKRWPWHWVGGHDFLNELVNVATVIQNLRDFKTRDNFRALFTQWKDMCKKILGSHKLKGRHLEEFTEGLLFKAFESYSKIEWHFEHTYEYYFLMRDYILSQAALFKKYGKVEITGTVYLERMAGEEAEIRAWEYVKVLCSMIPPPNQILREQKQDLDKWWEVVQEGNTPEEPNLEEKFEYLKKSGRSGRKEVKSLC